MLKDGNQIILRAPFSNVVYERLPFLPPSCRICLGDNLGVHIPGLVVLTRARVYTVATKFLTSNLGIWVISGATSRPRAFAANFSMAPLRFCHNTQAQKAA